MFEIYVSSIQSRVENYIGEHKKNWFCWMCFFKSLVSLDSILNSPDFIEFNCATVSVCLKTTHRFRMIPLSLFALTLSHFCMFCLCGSVKWRVYPKWKLSFIHPYVVTKLFFFWGTQNEKFLLFQWSCHFFSQSVIDSVLKTSVNDLLMNWTLRTNDLDWKRKLWE